MSGPVTTTDADAVGHGAHPSPATVEITESREARVGSVPVRRALPRRARRTVGAWCFVDHVGPVAVDEDRGVDIGPHTHTWTAEEPRFGTVASALPRIPVAPPPWSTGADP